MTAGCSWGALPSFMFTVHLSILWYSYCFLRQAFDYGFVLLFVFVFLFVERSGTLIKRWLRPTAAFLATLTAAVLVATIAGKSVRIYSIL